MLNHIYDWIFKHPEAAWGWICAVFALIGAAAAVWLSFSPV